MGIPFCYNWIKECGAIWLAKPDLHIARVVNTIIEHDYGSWDEFIIQTPVYAKYEAIKRKPKVYYEERVALFIWEWANKIQKSGVDADISASCRALIGRVDNTTNWYFGVFVLKALH